MGELDLSPDSRGRSSPAFPVTNRVWKKTQSRWWTSSAGLPCRRPCAILMKCPCATPGSPPASSAGRGCSTALSRNPLYHNHNRCTSPRSRPSWTARTGRSAGGGTPWSRRVLLVQNSGRSPACLPFPRSSPGLRFRARRGSRARRAGPLRFRKAARWLGRRFRHCAPRHRLGAAQKPGPRADRESMVRWRSRAPLDA